MAALLIGYARCSTDQQDLTAQRDGLVGLGVPAHRSHVDHGLTGTNRQRPGLREALAACRDGNTLVVTELDRLARSLPDARAITEELTTRQVQLSLGESVYDPHDAGVKGDAITLAQADRLDGIYAHRHDLSHELVK
jgi:DNA invertase Pin-like site-specific DNA recombinase